MLDNSSKTLQIDFTKEREEGYKRVFNRSPLVSSQSVGWDNLTIVYDRQPAIELPKTCLKQHCIGILTDIPLPMQTERIIDGRFLREQNVQGDLIIIPANTTHQAAWYSEGCSVAIMIEPRVVAQTIYEVVNPDKIEILPQFATADPFVYQIGVALKSALIKNGSTSRLYAESLMNALIIHLLENYSTTRKNSFEPIAGTLPQYFSRLFKETTGFTPHQYVINCRIERAKYLLKQGNLSIAEIAKEVGFVDQSHLHRYFKRKVGITPKQFSQQYKK